MDISTLHHNSINMTGQRFGRLVVLTYAGKGTRKGRGTRWKCSCDCGNDFVTSSGQLRNGSTISCGCYRRTQLGLANIGKKGPSSPAWKGGKRVTHRGYIQIWNDTTNRYQFEHRCVMEKHLGRPLLKKETIHHKNGDKKDNRLENLELWSKSHPSGQKIVDKIDWCIDFLQQYAPQVLA